MGIYALAAKKLTAAVNGRLKAKPRKGAQRRRCAVVRRCVVSTDRLWGAIVRFDDDDDEHNLSVLGGVRV